MTWEARRLVIEVGASFDEAVARYEAAVPGYPAGEIEGLTDWEQVRALTDRVAVNGFLIYWRFAADRLMEIAGDPARCRVYLMGNHLLAERMYRHDPAAMLHAPLRTVISQAEGEAVRFAIEQPSRQFASFGIPEIAAVGVELDRKLAVLLERLGWPVPDGLGGQAARVI
ncbi:DUF302 domain-containing protein [Dactylosporangium sp. NPDC000244]|uniref:DUF302 domain-containing protein n=1 Tax=Dactylosporangium sp. NPDC000244 TaxID=3154365 RepID=UPI003325856A